MKTPYINSLAEDGMSWHQVSIELIHILIQESSYRHFMSIGFAPLREAASKQVHSVVLRL
jgi:hypothetical protein